MDNLKKTDLTRNHALWKLPVVVSIFVVLLAAGVRWGSAQDAGPSTAPIIEPQSPQGWGDEGIKEVGVEWINDFPGTANDRSHWDESCDGLYYGLTSVGWTGRFHWTDWSAYETDFKLASLGGAENSYVDNVDIAMVCTHGASTYDSFWDKDLSSVYFGSSHADQHLSPGEAYQAYGDKDLEYLAFDSCSVLSDGGAAPYYNRGYWSTVMNGLHLLLGFKNTMYVWAPGDGVYWALFMKGFGFLPPLTVTQSWFLAVDYNQPTVTCARVLAEEYYNYSEYLHGYGYMGPDPVPNGYYWYWDHCSTGAKKLELDVASPSQPVQQTLPVFQVQNRLVDENYVQGQIAPAFNISGTLGADELFFYLVDTSKGITRTLMVDKITGSFNFRNWGSLWVAPVVTPTLPANVRVAMMLADNFFSQVGEGLPGVWWRNNTPDYEIEGLVQEQFLGNSVKQISSMPADGMLTYGRNLSVQVPSANGIQMVDYPVVGPGGRLKIYFGDGNEIIGMMGGTREVVMTKANVEVMPAEEAWAMYLADPTLALPEVPWVASYISYTAASLGYYEMPYIISQTELIPVWIFNANFFGPAMELLAGDVPVNVPAALVYMSPEVSITLPVSGTLFATGELISFNGSVSGGKPPYTYAWSSSQDGFLGDAEAIVASLSGAVKGGDVLYHAIELQVTDANGQSGSATVLVKVMAPLYLPSINKPTAK